VDAAQIAPLSGNGVASITEPLDRVRGAALTIDTLPWQAPAYAYAFTPTDGSFDSLTEVVAATVEVACLPSGRHTLYLQAEDEAGDRGIAAAQFVTVTNTSEFTVTVHATGAETSKSEPVTYTVILTNTGATTATLVLDALTSAGTVVVPSQPYTLAPGASQPLAVVITPPKNITADTMVSTVINVRSTTNPSQCRQALANTSVQPWAHIQHLVSIRKN
jgi:hypothetical protein